MTFKVAIATATALAFAVPAAAAPVADASADIRFGDLNLSSSKGFARLTRRIDQAADQICGAPPRGLVQRVSYEECRSDVTEQAHNKLRRQLIAAPVEMAAR